MTTSPRTLPQEQLGPAEQLLDLVLNASAHLWHNRPGVDVAGKWYPGTDRNAPRGTPIDAGLFVPAAERLYARLLAIYELNTQLMSHFASYVLLQTDWRDLKVACAALMLVQPHAGQPVKDGDEVAFHDDDLRRIGEAMLLHYERKSARMMTPKAILRVAELLEVPQIAALNRAAGFADAAGTKAPLGRWAKAATKWLAIREKNPRMLEGLVKAGYKETIKNIARKVGYKPASEHFFAVLGWKQTQADEGHRTLGLDGLQLETRERFDDLSEAEICETIASQKLAYKEVMGRLPKDIGLTPAIMVALLPSLSDRDLRQLTPTLEELGLLSVPDIRDVWEKALDAATDQRALNIAKNVQNQEIRDKLEASSDKAAQKAVAAATKEQDIHVMFLIDRSGSMQGALEKSVEALSRILAGFALDRVHVASFDTMGVTHRPKAPSRAAVQHMLSGVKAGGGTLYSAAPRALHRDGVRIPTTAKLVVIAVGDEDGETGAQLAQAFGECGYTVSAIALVLNVAYRRGTTVIDAARALGVPFSLVEIEQFDDPYQVTRVLQTLLEAPPPSALPGVVQSGWVEKVMATPIIDVV